MAALRGDLAEAVNPAGSTAGDTPLGRSAVVRLSALAVLIAGTVAGGHLLNAWMDPLAELRGWVNWAGSAGPPLFVALFLALNTGGVPLPVLGAAAGVAFGPVSGATTALVAMTITACAQFLLARYVVGGRVRQRLGHALARVNQRLERRGAIAVAGARLLPVPFSEFNMLAGLTLLKLRDFTIGTVIGCAPKALVWSGIGAILF
jgi:uncharacterized membrane protein YdjX (TVP38/TMEM64 family)